MLLRKRAWDLMRDGLPEIRENAGVKEIVQLMDQAYKDFGGAALVLVYDKEGAFRGVATPGHVLEALEHGPDSLRVVPCGSEADVVLSDPRGDVFRPVGVALEVHGQTALFDGRGFVEAARGLGGEPAALPVALVFELPERAEVYRLHVLDLPPLRIEVSPSPDHEEDRG